MCLLSPATFHVCLTIPLTTWEVCDVAKRRIESNYRLTHRIPGCCDLCQGLHKQLGVFIWCILEDWYGFDPHCFLLVFKHFRLIVQHFPTVAVNAEQFFNEAYIYFSLSDVSFGPAKSVAGCYRPVGLWGALLFTISSLLWDATVLFPSGSWRGRTSLIVSGGWQNRTGVFCGGCWQNLMGLFLGWSASSILRSILGQVHQ